MNTLSSSQQNFLTLGYYLGKSEDSWPTVPALTVFERYTDKWTALFGNQQLAGVLTKLYGQAVKHADSVEARRSASLRVERSMTGMADLRAGLRASVQATGSFCIAHGVDLDECGTSH